MPLGYTTFILMLKGVWTPQDVATVMLTPKMGNNTSFMKTHDHPVEHTVEADGTSCPMKTSLNYKN